MTATPSEMIPATDSLATITPQKTAKIDQHPAIEELTEFLNFGTVNIDGEQIETVKDLVELLNQKYPSEKLTPSAVTRLKKRMMREKGGYVLRDGRLARGDGTVVQPIDPLPALDVVIHLGVENLLNNPWKIRADDIVKAIAMRRELVKEVEETDEFGQAWSNYFRDSRGKRRRRKVVDVPTEAPELESES